MKVSRFITISGLLMATALGLSACSVADQSGSSDSSTDGASETVTIMTHDSFSISDELKDKFEEESGYTLQTTQPGDAGAVVNQLILQKEQPTVDGVYGIDSYSAERLVGEDMLTDFTGELPEGATELTLDGAGENQMIPIDQGQVCVNVDTEWFEAEDREVPADLDELVEPENAELFVTTDATSSSPGLAFLVATITEKGEDWEDYWTTLLDNGAKVADGWSAAYYEDFTATSDTGQYPLVLSYSSSPSAEEGRTSVIDTTCTPQVEYAGVLAEGKNPEGAQAFFEFLLDEEFQTELITSMYMYPVDSTVELPEEWAEYAQLVEDPIEPDLKEVAEKRDDWLRDWADIFEAQD